MSTPKSPQPALSRTPGRLRTPPSRELGGVLDSQHLPSDLPNQFDGLSQGTNGTASIPPDTATDRRSFFGRLFKPSTDNLRTHATGKSVPPPSLSRHGRHQSQQSIASTAETFTEDSEVDDVTDSRRRERNKRVLMGRSVASSKRDVAHNSEDDKGVPRVHVHAPIPNPRRAASGSAAGGRQPRDQRELSVIEDEDADDNGDVTIEGKEVIAAGAKEDVDALQQGEGAETVQESSTLEAPAAISAPASPAPEIVPDENPTDSPSNVLSETDPPPSLVNVEQSVGTTPGSTDDDEREEGDDDREIPAAPPSPSLEHELETIKDSSRRKGRA